MIKREYTPAKLFQSRLPVKAVILLSVSFLLPALLLISFLSCAKVPGPFAKETYVMGTKAEITIYGIDRGKAMEAAGEALHELHRIESVMSTWRVDSEISLLNAESSEKPYRIGRELFSLIESSFHFSEITGGAFDITAGPLVKMWGFQGGEPVLPSRDTIDETLSRVGYRKVILDADSSTVTLPEGMRLDVAGIAKGYGVDRCVSILKGLGVKRALVNLGGNIYAIGSPPGRKSWTVGVRDPYGGKGTIGSIALKNEAVATSGNYENFVLMGGRRYGHIVDPRTGLTVDSVLSVTVVAPTAVESDALSTGLFVLGVEDGSKAIASLPGVKALFALPSVDGALYESAGDFGASLDIYPVVQGGN